MNIADKPIRIYNADQWHSAKFKNVDLLFVAPRHRMIRIWQPDKWKFFRVPIRTKSTRSIRPDSENFRTAACKLRVINTQARQLRAAIWSEKAAQESQHNRFTAKIRKSDGIFVNIVEFEFKGGFARVKEFCHWVTDFKN